jgi:hypothetical protein
MTTIQLDDVAFGHAPVVTVFLDPAVFYNDIGARLYLYPVPDTTGGIGLAGSAELEYIPLGTGQTVFTRTIGWGAIAEGLFVLPSGSFRIVLFNRLDGVLAESEIFTVQAEGRNMTGVGFKHAVGIRIMDDGSYDFQDQRAIASAISSLKSARKTIQDELLVMTPVVSDTDGKINLYGVESSDDIVSADKAKYIAALNTAFTLLGNNLTALQNLNLQA